MLSVPFQLSYFVTKCVQKPALENNTEEHVVQLVRKMGVRTVSASMCQGAMLCTKPKASLDAALHHWEQWGCVQIFDQGPA